VLLLANGNVKRYWCGKSAGGINLADSYLNLEIHIISRFTWAMSHYIGDI